MRKIDVAQRIALPFILSFLFGIPIQGYMGEPINYSYNNCRNCGSPNASTANEEPISYTSIDYSYYGPAYGRGSRNLNDPSRFGQRYDNSDNFSSGISSYQGTSTGPGPNGGYPGAPRGIYPTNYVDTSIYPNTYKRM